ncbi:hypothetical protein ACHAC9_14015 [Massilia sp. CMS3.1]|uniref:hypothetical protein n=1 Tax=Massilia sp. CMS3.1 TaxID=3373083 RepID=UPI003EE4BADF
MKTIWSTFVSFLLLLLVLMIFGFAFVTTKPLPMKLGSVAMGLCFLVTFISATWPDRRIANKLVKVLNFCAAGSFFAAMIMVLQHYFNTVSMT